MSAPPPPFAKLVRPSLSRLQSRPRLLQRLACRDHRPIVWVTGPPGYGKTSLAVDWLEQTRPAAEVWCQFDADDSDAATFFYYLSMAGPSGPPCTPAPPLFARELAGNLGRFARAFFREFYARLPLPATVVFDDVHELEGDGLAALAIGLGEAPPGVTVVALSRCDPPAPLARLEAHGRIARVHPSELRLTDEEALQFAAALDCGVADQLRELLPRLQGWPAGIAVTIEHLVQGRAGEGPAPGADRHTLFRYFATEVFEHAPPRVQNVLMACALLPSVTAAQACELSGDPDAGATLEGLYGRRLFVDRRGDHEPSYGFHALFHEFLRARLAAWPASARHDLAGRCARLLANAGRWDEAAPLFREAGDWAGLTALLAARADDMLNQGRTHHWQAWLEWLPPAERTHDTWLLYWSGVAQLRSAHGAARELLEEAYRRFAATAHMRGCLLTAAELILYHHYERADYCALPRWVETLRADIGVLHTDPQLLSADERLRVHAALLIGLLFHRPDDTLLQECALQVRQGLREAPGPNGRLAAGTLLLHYLNHTEAGRHAQTLVAQLEPIAQQPQIWPFVRICWRARLALTQFFGGEFAASMTTLQAARHEAEDFGLSHLVVTIDLNAALVQVLAGRAEDARATLDRLRPLLDPRRRLDAVYFDYTQTRLELSLGQAEGLAARADALVQAARELEMTAVHLSHFVALAAGCHLLAGNCEEAQRAYAEAAATGTATNGARYRVLRHFAEAHLLLRGGRIGEATVPLAAGFAEHKRLGWVPQLSALGGVFQTVCAAAIEADIETAHVRRLIVQHRLAAPRYYLSLWPWPIQLRLLGKFTLAVGGEEAQFKGKTQRRPFELVSAIVACGRREVDSVWLRDRLWPDADGAAARTTFDSTVYRLRKLLGSETAVYLSGGHVGLDQEVLWTDVWALAALAQDVRELGPQAPRRHAERLGKCLFDLYRGPFCGEEAAAWAISARDRCRNQFVSCVGGLGAYWEQRGEFGHAAALYERALQLDDSAESLYQGAIRCAIAGNDATAALNAYLRCGRMLSSALGTRPCAATTQLVDALLPRLSRKTDA